eukprot:3327678-Amphidinium_carterae.2
MHFTMLAAKDEVTLNHETALPEHLNTQVSKSSQTCDQDNNIRYSSCSCSVVCFDHVLRTRIMVSLWNGSRPHAVAKYRHNQVDHHSQ